MSHLLLGHSTFYKFYFYFWAMTFLAVLSEHPNEMSILHSAQSMI